MKISIITVIALVVGVLILGAGIYYSVKEKEDAESRKIYGVTIGIGLIMCIAAAVKIVISGI